MQIMQKNVAVFSDFKFDEYKLMIGSNLFSLEEHCSYLSTLKCFEQHSFSLNSKSVKAQRFFKKKKHFKIFRHFSTFLYLLSLFVIRKLTCALI